MITQNKKELASDLSNYIAIEYKYPEVSHEFNRYYPVFEKQLHAAIDEVLEHPSRPDNPVRDFIGDRNIFRNEQRIKEVKGNIEIMGLLLKEFLSNTAHIGKQMENWSEGKSKTLYKLENTAGPFLNRLILLNEKETVISFVKEIVRDIQAIEYNMDGVMNSIIKKKDLKACPEIFFGFQDSSGKIHSILDLYDHYKKFRKDIDINTLEPCPVVLSFQKFIKDWNDELEKLSK